ncbi:MAG: hypothetical protein EOO80_17170 [Oxalobacteraceae bacterium]|nr:MAG: hypothetical protein EOO80_17170 [Oxalobacteraceae bacterium]
MRAKTEYVQEKDERTGRQTVRKIGLAPIMRDGIEYEFTTFLELDLHHMAFAGKDRTRLFDGSIFKPELETGRQLLSWLDAGVDAPVKRTVAENEKTVMLQAISSADTLEDLFKAFSSAYRVATALSDTQTLAELTSLKNERKAWLESQHEEQAYDIAA